jgi:hypothetical protein
MCWLRARLVRTVDRAEAAGVPPLAAPGAAADGSPPPPPVPELTTVNEFKLVEVQGQLSDHGRLLGYLRAVASAAGVRKTHTFCAISY